MAAQPDRASPLGRIPSVAASPTLGIKNEPGADDRSDIKCPVSGCTVYTPRGFNLRHHICAEHQRVDSVIVDGVPHRFCQQCTKLHPLDMFSGNKRACKERLDRHNKRRKMRKHLAKVLEETGSTEVGSLSQKQILDLAVRLHSEMSHKVEGISSHNTGSAVDPTSVVTGEDDCQAAVRQVPVCHDVSTQVSDGMLEPEAPVARTEEPSTHKHSSMAARVAAQDCHTNAFISGMSSRHPSHRHNGRVSNTSGDFTNFEGTHCGGELTRFGAALSQQGRLEDIIRTGSFCFHCNGMGCNHCAWYYQQMSSHDRMFANNSAHERMQNEEDMQERVYNLSMKIMGATPHHLPPSLREEITSWLQCSPVSISGCIRPGCVHLSIDITLATSADYARALRDLPVAFAASVASANPSLPWCSHWTLLWLPNCVIDAKDGAVRSTRPRALEPLQLWRACVVGDTVWVSGQALRLPGVKLLLRSPSVASWTCLPMQCIGEGVGMAYLPKGKALQPDSVLELVQEFGERMAQSMPFPLAPIAAPPSQTDQHVSPHRLRRLGMPGFSVGDMLLADSRLSLFRRQLASVARAS